MHTGSGCATRSTGARSRGGSAVAIKCDVTREEDVQRLVGDAIATFGHLDVLVNNAGAIRRGRLLHETPDDIWEDLVSVNLDGVYRVTRAVLGVMLRGTEDRCIVNIASALANVPTRGIAAYAASKGGVIALTRSLAVEYARDGIRANCVCPGLVVTAITYVDQASFDDRRQALKRSTRSAGLAYPRTLPLRWRTWRLRTRPG